MTRSKKIAKEIADFINDPQERMTSLIRAPLNQSQVVFYDESVFTQDIIPIANEHLSKERQIDLRMDLMGVRDLDKISTILGDESLRPAQGAHLAFQIMDKDIADRIKAELQIEVFGL